MNAGLTREQLALRTGTTRQTIWAIETGRSRPKAPLACDIAQVFRCRATDFFERDGQPVAGPESDGRAA